jgi:transposase
VYRVHLTQEQRKELKQRTHAPGVMPRTRDRLEMVRLSDAGWSIPQIARHLQISEVRVRHWVKRFLQGGFDALPDAPHVGQQSSLTPAILEALRQEFAKQDRSWTAPQIAFWVAEHHGVYLSPQQLSHLLKRAGMSYKRTHRSLKHQQDPGAVAAVRADLETFAGGATLGSSTCATSTRRALPPRCRPTTVGGPSASGS